jgi:DNA mismatch repair protein MutL
MPIRVLDATVAAQIAAGEVVERPASVVKELVENALDSGATRIGVEAREGGRREIKVQDNGSGMLADEVALAFERHATSKLQTADDLWRVGTLGFRGEALPSIASVAQVACITRAASEELGTEIRIAGGELQGLERRGCSPGTSFSVRNLFYNTPVRREFLRSDSTELSAVSAVVSQYALAYPEVRFTLLLDGRVALQTSGAGDRREVVATIYGLDVARQLIELDVVAGEGAEAVELRGLISPPGLTRASRGSLHMFVNRRAIAARGPIAYVVEEAYHTMLMKGRHPLAVLDLRVHPGVVDVNVHPTKSEVKFLHQHQVFGVLGRSVREALIDSSDLRPWEQPGYAPPAYEPMQRRFELRPPFEQEHGTGDREQRVGNRGQGEHDGRAPTSGWSVPAYDERGEPFVGNTAWLPARPMTDEAAAREGASLPPLRVLGQVANTYIVAESPEGLVLIDQHAAHERVSYERLMRTRGQGAVESQALLLPQHVELPPAAAQLLLGQAEQLAEWGFDLDDFGGGTLLVRAIPSAIAQGRIAEALLEIADHLRGAGGSTPTDWRESMLTTLACHSSIRAHQALSPDEMRELIRQLEQCVMPRTCPHGRPTMIALSVGTLERQFGRAG